MKQPMFSVIVVALNPGDKLIQTIDSVKKQGYQDYEILVKDGGSKDGSIEALKELLKKETEAFQNKVIIVEKPDTSIYDGMNQAIKEAKGQFLYFLNCGDFLAEETILEEIVTYITSMPEDKTPKILYGDIFDTSRDSKVASNPNINGFACYRNVPCHQACIYEYTLFEERGYETKYKVRGDYEHFLWCFYEKKVRPQYMPIVIAKYEGSGFSEMTSNLKCSAKEHEEITKLYMKKSERWKYKAILWLTLAPVRTKIANSPAMAGFYNKCKNLVYKGGK